MQLKLGFPKWSLSAEKAAQAVMLAQNLSQTTSENALPKLTTSVFHTLAAVPSKPPYLWNAFGSQRRSNVPNPKSHIRITILTIKPLPEYNS